MTRRAASSVMCPARTKPRSLWMISISIRGGANAPASIALLTICVRAEPSSNSKTADASRTALIEDARQVSFAFFPILADVLGRRALEFGSWKLVELFEPFRPRGLGEILADQPEQVITKRDAFLRGAPLQFVVHLVRKVLDLEVRHGMTLACRWHAKWLRGRSARAQAWPARTTRSRGSA